MWGHGYFIRLFVLGSCTCDYGVGKKQYHNNSCSRIPKGIYLDTSSRKYIFQMWKLQSASSIYVLKMVNFAIEGTSNFLKFEVYKTMEHGKLRMVASRRAFEVSSTFSGKVSTSWVEQDLCDHLRNELVCFEDKIFQT